MKKLLITFVILAATLAHGQDYKHKTVTIANAHTGTVLSVLDNMRGTLEGVWVDMVQAGATVDVSVVLSAFQTTGTDVELWGVDATAADVVTNGLGFAMANQDLTVKLENPLGLSNTVNVTIIFEK